jgi:hypothetical protein
LAQGETPRKEAGLAEKGIISDLDLDVGISFVAVEFDKSRFVTNP